VYGQDSSTRSRRAADGATRPRIATVEETVMRERLAMMREKMRDLGAELTNVFSNAIYDGFERGGKRGIATLAQGLIQMVQDVLLKRLADGLGEILGGVSIGAGGGGKGGFWKGIGMAALGAVFGGIGGGGGGGAKIGGVGASTAGVFTGGYAKGGFLAPGKLGIVGENGPEFAFGGRNGMTISPNGGGGRVNNYYSQLPPETRGSVRPRESRREQARQLVAAIQGANS